MMNTLKHTLNISLACLLLLPHCILADVYTLAQDESIIGEVSVTFASSEDTLPDIARAHDLGYYEIKRANPEVDMWLPGDGKKIILPKRYVLPVADHKGIIVNIPEMRLYYFPEAKPGEQKKVYTYPIGIGREGWSTPYIATSIIQKNKAPSWYPPDSVREHYLEEGRVLPKVVKPGPDNPLGDFAMRLGLPSYLIHGTNRPSGVGMRVSSGCIRLYPEDIEALFAMVSLGTAVRIVNQPYKVGVQRDTIFLEANPFLSEDAELFDGNLTSVVKMLVNFSKDLDYDVNWELAKTIINEKSGIPVNIGEIRGPAPEYTDADAAVSSTMDLELKLETAIHFQ